MPQPPAKQRIAKKPPAVIIEWVVFLERSLKASFHHGGVPKVSQDSFAILGAHLSQVGTTSDPEAIRVYAALVRLLFSWKRLQWARGDSLRTHLKHLPIDRESLLQLATAIEKTSAIEPLEKASFPLVNFITVAAQLPDPAAYIAVCQRGGMTKIREIFHPNTLEFTSKRYRGLFTKDLASPEFHEQVGRIPTVR